ncbi:MAG: CinA family protein [Muribaculum sp.]|nr:CinA family protein [Muribaculum sp.]
MNKKNTTRNSGKHTETRHVVIYGYTRQELMKVMRHFEQQLPEFVKITIDNSNLVTKITLTGIDDGVELLRFRMNRYQQNIHDLFEHETVATDDKSVAQVLGELLKERELSVSSAESCTGGNIAHRITQVPGSSTYFLGSVVSYSNDVKADILNVSRSDIGRYGAVSKQVVEQMAMGISSLMHSDCSIATSGIAGPDGGTRFKPVGTVWIGVKYNDTIVSECVHFDGNRNAVIESATDHGMVMLINLLRDKYESQEEYTDE